MRNVLLVIVAVLVIGSCIFMFAISPISKTEKVDEIGNLEMLEANTTTDELIKGVVVEQNFINRTENINEIAVVFTRMYYLEEADANTEVTIELCEGRNVLASHKIVANDIPDQHRVYVNPQTPITGMVGKELTIKIYESSNCDTGVCLMANDSSNTNYKFGNKKYSGSICFSVSGE